LIIPWVALGPRIFTLPDPRMFTYFNPLWLFNAVGRCTCAGGQFSASKHWTVSGDIVERTVI